MAHNITCQDCKVTVPCVREGCSNCGSLDFGIKDPAALEGVLREPDFPMVQTTRKKK